MSRRGTPHGRVRPPIEHEIRACREPDQGVGRGPGGPPHFVGDHPVIGRLIPVYSDTAFDSINARNAARNSSTACTPWSPCLRLRTETWPFCCSRSPTTSMNGIFCNCASRILKLTFSLRSRSEEHTSELQSL